MNTWEADGIADKLCHSWPNSSITAKAWSDELLELDKARAEEAARQLVRNSERAPSIAQFLGVYHNLAGSARTEWTCPTCDNTGWVTDLLHPEHHGYWAQHPTLRMPVLHVPVTRVDEHGKQVTTIEPDPSVCCCNLVTPCPRCNRKAA